MPNKELLDRYKNDYQSLKVSNGFLITYKGSQYSVPPKLINQTVKVCELDNKLYIYYNEKFITCHDISLNKINYKQEHYSEGLSMVLKNKTNEDIEKMAKKNLELFDNLLK